MSNNQQEYNRLLDMARVALPAASDAGIKQIVYERLHEFFDITSMWAENICFTTSDCCTSYDLVASPPGQIIRLVWVLDSNNCWVVASMEHPATITLRDTPQAGLVFTARVTKTVALPLTRDDLPEVPDWFLPQWSPVVASGVIGTMAGQSSKPYSNPSLANVELRRYRDGVARARAATTRHNTYGSQSWTFPQGYRTRGQKGGVSVGNTGRF